MKKILVLAALGLGSVASATTWEYATYSEVDSIGRVLWETPTETVSGKSIDDILTGMKCDKKGLFGFLNCAGAQGWELVQYAETGGKFSVASYIFKRAKQ